MDFEHLAEKDCLSVLAPGFLTSRAKTSSTAASVSEIAYSTEQKQDWQPGASHVYSPVLIMRTSIENHFSTKSASHKSLIHVIDFSAGRQGDYNIHLVVEDNRVQHSPNCRILLL